ncbi:hypothetical protein [Burkholderia mayonis]|uniref:Uncharacterized protein n=1 Tax=Burkholderia mayonis TaxID=1385591 RepID=A0A1B4G255_9BURK|nr:hypothetical protein [Burkholderia mayonis]AOJ10001.1 hypothetical protein WS71_22375 [Burkholderia mayonis]KVE54022.1 hypothetical protein WS71_05435 [Burkholderia mayonis]
MHYVTSYSDIFYLVDGTLAVCRYRLIAVNDEPRQVVIQIDNHCGPEGVLIADHNVRDAVLNRIADRDLHGIPVNMLCLALTNAGTHHVVFVEPDLENYVQRGNPYAFTAEPGKRGRYFERISIHSRDLVVGRARLQTAHSKLALADADLTANLDHA